ncbi:hypothetical protein KSF_088360 [Reticulibacter mediterranei]|uniref:Uncharacterized protein n=1 Tax=Reticulibacter mediterranei TaxID=2778369 RepID=A0A8J3IUI1_9CHLR|nr:hypothetical protein [Reticulibacter mediterranei]GHO98788.1 hypothetical protein KSF_088360 [Reticulibacter mediterranei]
MPVAYATGLHLSEEERRAIPDVLRLREAGGLIHHMQRYFAGMETDARIKAQVEQALWREAWLRTHGKTLREYAMTW